MPNKRHGVGLGTHSSLTSLAYDSLMAQIPPPSLLELAIDVGIPSIAIIVSTVLAVWIASTERKAAARAREEERLQVARDRRDDRSQDAFVRTLSALTTFMLFDVVQDSPAEPLKELRIGLSLLDVAADRQDEVLTNWFTLERGRAAVRLNAAGKAINDLHYRDRFDIPGDERVRIGQPLYGWANEFSGRLQEWRRDRVTDDQVRAFVIEAQTELGPVVSQHLSD